MTNPINNKILIIDDDSIARMSVASYLDDAGFEVFQAEDGDEGLIAFAKYKPALVLSDLKMPKKGGLEVLKELAIKSPKTPVIIISGAGELNDVINSLRLGAWDYLTKPIADYAVLEHAVCKCLERSRLIEDNELYRNQLENANRELLDSYSVLKEDQQAARNVQVKLLPKSNETIGNYKFNYSVTPSLYLSGDFVDFFAISEDKYGFYLADVSGHGAPSAIVTVLLKSLMNQFCAKYGAKVSNVILNPAKLLESLSKELFEAKIGKYLTIVYGVIDEKEKVLNYSIGGHFPNPIIKINKEVKYLEGKGFPVGVFGNATYENKQIKLPKEFTLAVFSDGILEIMPCKNLEEKEKMLLSLIKDPKASVDWLNSKFSLDEKEEYPDDITFLFVSNSEKNNDGRQDRICS